MIRLGTRLGCVVIFLCVGPAAAGENTWTGPTVANWDTSSSNWTSPAVWNNTNMDDAVFSTAGAYTITASNPITVNGILFSANNYTIGGTSTLTLATGSGDTLGAGEIQVANAVTGTINAPIAGAVGLNKTGLGTLVLGNSGGIYPNPTTVSSGTLSIAAGLANPVTLVGVTTQAVGMITIGANSSVNVNGFQAIGVLNILPGTSGSFTLMTNTGTSPLAFNGGSRTYIGTPATASSSSPVDFLDLNGQNALVTGGLFVNNGAIVDSSSGGLGTIIADYGALVKGAGTYDNSVITQHGAKFQAGNSPGLASFGRFVFGPGGVNNYIFAIDDATGTAGPSPDAAGQVSGWGLVKTVKQVGSVSTGGDFTWTATPTDQLAVAIDTLVNPTTVGTDVAGPMANFDPTHSYSWPAAHWTGTYAGPTDAAMLNADTAFDTSGFLNPVSGTFGWSLEPVGQTLSLIYTPSAVPEPGTLCVTGLAGLGFGWAARRRAHFNFSRHSAAFSGLPHASYNLTTLPPTAWTADFGAPRTPRSASKLPTSNDSASA